jgi:type IV pilus assembly protein PilM
VPIQRRNLIGVDIGTSAVKLARCAGGRAWKFGMAALPDGVMSGNHINSAKLVASSVKKAQASGRIGGGGAALCLSGADVIIRQTVMPRMNPEQLKQNVIDEISGYLAVDPAMYVIDYKVQEVLHDGGAAQFKLMIVAVPRNIVEAHIRALALAGLRVVTVDVAANAKEKLVNYLSAQQGSYAVIDLGMNDTEIDTYLNNRYFVSKSSAMGLNAAVAALGKALETDPLRALDMILDGDPSESCRQAVNDYAEQVLYDAVRVTDYFRSRNQSPVEQIYLCGGGAKVPGIQQMVQDRMGIPARDVSALLAGVAPGRGESKARLSVCASAAGAALTEVG